ncbi:MAG: hypothetical protein MUC79_10495 [Thiobacillaceae bacterium]|nr:hypothetical protein [Thiobacillaceae bacterium]
MNPNCDDVTVDWEDADDPFAQDDFYDDLAYLYLVSGGVWPDARALDRLPRLEASLRVADFFDDLAPELDK